MQEVGLSNGDIAAAIGAGAILPDEADGVVIMATVDGGRVSTEGLRAAGLFIDTSATFVPSYVKASYLGKSTTGTGTDVRTLCILKVNGSGLLQVKDFTTRLEGEVKLLDPARFLWVQIPTTSLVDVVPLIDMPQMPTPSSPESALEVALRAVLQGKNITGEQLRETAQKWLTPGYSKTVDAIRADEEFYTGRAHDDPQDPAPTTLCVHDFSQTLAGQLFFLRADEKRAEHGPQWEPTLPAMEKMGCSLIIANYAADMKLCVFDSLASVLRRKGYSDEATHMVRAAFGDKTIRDAIFGVLLNAYR